jgi:Flp pilus assembly protein TadD
MNLALALRQAGRLQEAEAQYREAVRLSPNGAPGRR